MTLYSDTEHAADTLTRVASHLTQRDRNGYTVLDRIRLCMSGHPRAASYDSAGGRSAGQVWCWTHERDVNRCHADELDCTGEAVTVTDRTGETAIGSDTAAQDMRRANHLARILASSAEQLADLLARYPEPRAASAWEREQTARENDPRCESCSRIEIVKGVPWWVEPHANGSGTPYRTTVDDKLAEPMYLCKACIGHVQSRGCLPNEDELEQRRAHGRIKRCPHPEVGEDAA